MLNALTRCRTAPAAVARAFSLTALIAAASAVLPTATPAQQPRTTARAPQPNATRATPARSWPDSAWRHIGPAYFGGRIDDIEAVADDPRIIFVGTASGGVFRTVNGGVTWEPVFDAYGTALSIGDIAIAPSDRNVVWVGTGEANNRQSSTWGDGVYRSLDGGTTWQHMGLRETQSIGRVVIHPRDPNTVFVAAVGHLWGPNEQRGLYRTRDGGKSWQKVLGVDDDTGVTDVAIASDGRTLYAATYMRRRRAWGFIGGGPTSGLWRSLDGGDTWERLTNGLPSGVTGRIGIDIAKSDENIVYAVIEHREGGVFRSTDRGATWTRQNPINDRPLYYSQIRVDPTNADRVWLLGTTMYRSVDGGKTFTSDSLIQNVHPDLHALWINPKQPEHMLLGTDGGVYFSYDGARNWDFVDNLPIGQFYDIAIDNREPYWIYGGLQDNGTFTFPSGTYSRGALTDADVTYIGYGDGFQVNVDPTNPRLAYTNSQNGRGYLTDIETREERRITPVPADGAERYRFNWNTATLVSPHDPRVYYYGANKLLRTVDRGTTWQEISPDLTRNQDGRTLSLGPDLPARDNTTPSRDDGVGAYGNITTISESPGKQGTIYVGTDDGNVQMTTDGGEHWTNITSRFRLPTPHPVSKVLASRHDARTAYVAFDGHTNDDMRPYIFKTTDGGATWRSIVGDLPAGIVVRTLTEDPRNPDLLYAGTEFGLYWSFDGGAHWSFPGGNLPRVQVMRIIVNERNNDLILGTHGRGVIILDDVRPLQAGAPAKATAPAQLFPLRDATQVYQWRDNTLGARKFAAPNAPVDALITYQLAGVSASGAPAPDTSAVRIQVVAPSGEVVRELSGPGTAGTHRVPWDLRTQLPFLPAPQDSGYYGAVRAPYVPPGTYTVKLTARGQTLTQPVMVRLDPRSITTPEAQRARQELKDKIVAVVRSFADGRRALAALDSEFTHVQALLRSRQVSPEIDSLTRQAHGQLVALRPRFGGQYGRTPIGNIFDVLGGLESSGATPTQAEERTFEVNAAEVRENIAKVNELVTNAMPKLRAALTGSRPVVSDAAAAVPVMLGASTPDSLARLVLARFSSGTPEGFDSVYPAPLGREVVRSAVERKATRQPGMGRVLWSSPTRAVLLLSGTVRMGAGTGLKAGGNETNLVRRLSGLHEAVRTGGSWVLTRQIPLDTANYIRGQKLHVALAPGKEHKFVDTLDVTIGSPYGFVARLNNAAKLTLVQLDGRPAEHELSGGVLWVKAPQRERARLVLHYTIADDRPRSVASAGPGAASDASAADSVPAYGSLHNTDVWHPFFGYDSGNDRAPISATVTLPAEYRLTTSVPQTETVRGGVRTVRAVSGHPQFLLALIYNRDWRPVTTDIGGARFETFITPEFRFTHDTLAAIARRVYRVLVPRFGEPLAPTRYLAAVEDRTLRGSGFTVRMNHAVVSGDNARALEEPVLGPSFVYAHEVSHGWTMGSTGLAANFLTEGWATFAESLVLRDMYGPDAERAFWERVRTSYITGMDRSGFRGGFEGNQSILGNPDNGRIHYFKGSWILRSLNHILGDAAFNAGMRAYIAHIAKGSAAGYQELIAGMSRAAGRDMTSFVMPWLTEKYIPDVDARVESGRLIVTQSQPSAVFDLPKLEIELTTASGPVRRTIHLTGRADTVDVAALGAISRVRVDPDHQFLLRRHWGDLARFELRAPDAKAVELTGNFLVEPIKATRNGDVWSVELPLTEGRYIWLWTVDGKRPSDDAVIAAVKAGDSGPTAIGGVRTVQPLRRLESTDAR